MAIYSPLLAPHILARRLQSGRACITELGLEQRCPRCGEFWPWDTEFFVTVHPDGIDRKK
ncbi:hypothetical protein KW556_10585 [Aeromonas veronii]|uniref:hypothetical protein n=1 Tax=Aeromonas veronii TaxID=654 RepID=UPI00217DC28B|nr:hypothetical protein [Aeromonas veronii]UWH30050.1 hypothetical protein KW556_10585 [Aeromonas veronii]